MFVRHFVLAFALAVLASGFSSQPGQGDSCIVPGSGGFFNSIAARYDLLNQVISLGFHGSWRTSAINKILPAQSVLDISTGTGDLAISVAANRSIRVVGLDPSPEMLKVARDKVNRFENSIGDIRLVTGVAEALPFDSDSFDAAAVAFGVRNFQDRQKGLNEMSRVLKPNGKWAILELSLTDGDQLLDRATRLFVTGIVPRVASIISGNRKAYEYLSDSMRKFPDEKEFCKMLEAAGLVVESQKRLSPLGMGPFLYSGIKSSDRDN
ncbi:Ubiquinone/menaquinone biosynthesis C-methyltransferase UbiE [Gracilariopsis chorda]|uniref:2-methoxy-6-polyprenyl-1,4-benzoquinol methylase, mitochondrial n=1 Tax=Gracilariopsis chorda TaxID=448386 RepID=A0A2V3IET2_9FLOR|nr:Ubiquinone/menaquinone biosynthesis C-methyltransferase UbiE [Gracilariopsis chorda]|eukprot:PXF40596.1 Ubiquinone/menaquinone biosynthesis C-methyltransferase UbiE [Gracilariopsis chorda]